MKSLVRDQIMTMKILELLKIEKIESIFDLLHNLTYDDETKIAIFR